jgi:glycerol-3-phosphate dehydrogenase
VTRDLGRLSDTVFDVLVIGAGIYGATIAWDAVQRGFSVALVDGGDFGGGASANSLKTVHGGLRSLQRGAVREMREFIRDRRTLLKIAPHLVHPLTFVIPTESHPLRSRSAMRAALALTDLIGRDRNDGLPPDQRLHGGRMLTRDELLAAAPDLDPGRVTGGAAWCDAQMRNSERLTLAFVHSAARAGAVVANHLAVERLCLDRRRVVGARVRERFSGDTFNVRAGVVVNAAGAWAPALTATAFDGGLPELFWPAFSRALNLVTRRPSTPPAVGGRSGDRFFFRVPWRGLTMYGTAHEQFSGSVDDARPRRDEVARLLDDVNRAFPRPPLAPDEVSLVHWGLLPTVRSHEPEVQLVKRSLVRDHRSDGLPGLITVLGVRYSTARTTAQEAVDTVERVLDRVGRACTTAFTALAGGEGDLARLRQIVVEAHPGMPENDIERVVRTYGSEVPRLLDVWRRQPETRAPLGPACPVTAGEVTIAVRDELALTLGDVLLRRTEAASAGHPGHRVLEAAADVAAPLLGWDAARRAREIASFDDHYVPA